MFTIQRCENEINKILENIERRQGIMENIDPFNPFGKQISKEISMILAVDYKMLTFYSKELIRAKKSEAMIGKAR